MKSLHSPEIGMFYLNTGPFPLKMEFIKPSIPGPYFFDGPKGKSP